MHFNFYKTLIFFKVSKDIEISKLLINAGVNVNAEDKYGRTPIFNGN